jgi:dienelactone hydrolase
MPFRLIIISLAFVLSLTASGVAGTESTSEGDNNGADIAEKKASQPIIYTQKGRFSIEVQLAGQTPAPTVILSHGSGGLWRHQRNWAVSLIEAGYNVAMIDHFTEKGVEPHISKVDIRTVPEARVKDLLAAASWVASQKWQKGKLGVIGFSQGGSGVNLLANTRMLKNLKLAEGYDLSIFGALVSYYPGCGIPFGGTPDLPYVPIQLHLGKLDALAEVIWCETGFRKNENLEIFIYPNAHHSFDVEVKDWKKIGFIPATGRLWEAKIDPEANKKSRERVFVHLDKHLK